MTSFGDGPAGRGLTFVGVPLEATRTADARDVDQARANFADHVHKTRQASMGVGGRYHAPGGFGALYRASGEATAWAEVAARHRREGVPGLPPVTGVLRVPIGSGRGAARPPSAARPRGVVSGGEPPAPMSNGAQGAGREELRG